MKSALKLSALLIVLSGFASCTATVYGPSWNYNCYSTYDYWGYYLGEDCYYEYYSQNGTLEKQLDMVADAADVEELKLQRTTEHYATKFNLSADKAQKIARNVIDFEALTDRSEDDIADFAQRLYGINTSDAISAVGSAQVGNNAALDSLIEEAAGNFDTSAANMKNIVKELHGKALSANGIEL